MAREIRERDCNCLLPVVAYANCPEREMAWGSTGIADRNVVGIVPCRGIRIREMGDAHLTHAHGNGI